MATRPAMTADGHTDYQENACVCREQSGQSLLPKALTEATFEVVVLENITAF